MADPRYPLPQTQAGVLEHLQFYVSDMSPGEHAECSEIIKHLRGSKRTTLGAYVTHIIVDEDACQSQEKRTILEFLEQNANVCTVVDPSWLRACAEVGPHSRLQDFVLTHVADSCQWTETIQNALHLLCECLVSRHA